jgi:hypothetical protein
VISEITRFTSDTYQPDETPGPSTEQWWREDRTKARQETLVEASLDGCWVGGGNGSSKVYEIVHSDDDCLAAVQDQMLLMDQNWQCGRAGIHCAVLTCK